jgi:glutamine amidotransferase
MGNLGSILNMLKKIGISATISSKTEDVMKADKLILPGVGAFDQGITNIKDMGLLPVLNEKILHQKTPVLGICLGMQLLTRRSEEGKLPGLGWIEGQTVRFHFDQKQTNLKIPHMGWNSVSVLHKDSLFQGLEEEAAFYFVHSYHVVCDHEADVLATTHHGYNFVSAIQKDNIFGTQFHPEKSHKYGLRILKNFVELT